MKMCGNYKANTKMATTSAAARAIDCFNFRLSVNSCAFRDGGSTYEVPRYFCKDYPYLKDARPELPDSIKGKLLSNPVGDKRLKPIDVIRDGIDDAQNNGATSTSDNCSTEQEHNNAVTRLRNVDVDLQHISNMNNSSTPDKENPKQELFEYYSKLLKVSTMGQLKNYFTVWEHRFGKSARYTCIFTDPITLETFTCGYMSEKKADVVIHENCFWYRKLLVILLLLLFLPGFAV